MAQTMEKASGDEWFLDGLDRHLHTAAKVIKLVYAATACFAVAVFSYYIIVLQSQATVYLDVNPSVQFELNSRDEVVVFDQDVYVDDELKAMAEQYKITPGKAELIRKLTSENPKLNYAELAVLPIKNLIERLNQEGIDLREYANYTGSGYNLETEEKDDSEEPEKESNDKEQEDDRYTDSQETEEEDDDSEEDWSQGRLPLNGPSQRNETSVSPVRRLEAEELEYEVTEPEEPEYETPEPEYEEPEYETPEPEYEAPEAEDDGEEEDD